MTNNTNNEITNNTNIENNGSSIYGKDIQDFDQMLSDTFSSVSILKDGSESFGNVTKKLMEGLKKQISVIFGKKIDVPFIFCLIDEKGTLQGTFNGFYDEYEKVLRESGEYFWENDYVPGKLFLPTFKNRQWSASPVMIYWNSTEFKNKEEFKESFNKTIGKFNKKYQNQIQFIGVYGSKDSVDNYKLKWGGIEANNPGINDSLSNNDGVQKGFLKAIAFLLQHTFKTSFASTPNDCYIFFIPSVFDADCRTGVLLLLLNPEDVLNETVQNDSESADIGKGLSRDEFYQKLLVITRAWGLATERQFLNHKNSRIQFQTIQEQADLFAEKVTSQTLEQYLEQAFQSKPEFRNRICFLDLHFCNQDERNSDDTNNIGITITLTKDKNRLNQDISNQGEQILIQGFNNDNSLDIIKTIANDDSLNDSFKYWESHIDNSKDAGTWSTWSRYINTIKDHKDELKSYNNHEITHVVGIPFFDQDKKYIAGVLVGFASKNNENRKEDEFNKNFIEWLHLIIRQLTSAYIINTNRVIDQERSNFATAAYRIGHPLKDRTTLIAPPLNTIQDWLDENAEVYKFSNDDCQKLQFCIDKIESVTDLISGFGRVLNILSEAIKEPEKKEGVFLKRNKIRIASEPYDIKENIKLFVTDENRVRTSDNDEIEVNFNFSDNPVILPWIRQKDDTCYRPFNLIYDEIFRETLLNARKYGKAESSIDNNVQKNVIKIDVRQEVIEIDNLSKDKIRKNCLVFSNKSVENEADIKNNLNLTKDWVHPLRCKPGGGIIWLTTLLEVTNIGNVNLRYNNGYFETAFNLNGMTNDR